MKRRTTGVALTARAVRKELKEAFPGVKFSVKSSNFSGGDSIDVSYTDGPALNEVESLTDKYKAGTFNGMTDSYEYDYDRDPDQLTTKYLFVTRSFSEEVKNPLLEELRKDFGIENLVSDNEYLPMHGGSLNNIVYRELINKTL